MSDPITRDLRACKVAAWASAILLALMLGAGGMVLKHERKTKTISYGGCYVWSDGLIDCGSRP